MEVDVRIFVDVYGGVVECCKQAGINLDGNSSVKDGIRTRKSGQRGNRSKRATTHCFAAYASRSCETFILSSVASAGGVKRSRKRKSTWTKKSRFG